MVRRLAGWCVLVAFVVATLCPPNARANERPDLAFDALPAAEHQRVATSPLPVTALVMEEARAHGIDATWQGSDENVQTRLANFAARLERPGSQQLLPSELASAKELLELATQVTRRRLASVIEDDRFEERAAREILSHVGVTVVQPAGGPTTPKAHLLAVVLTELEEAQARALVRLSRGVSCQQLATHLTAALSPRRGELVMLATAGVLFVIVLAVEAIFFDDEGMEGVSDAGERVHIADDDEAATVTVYGERPERLVIEYSKSEAPVVKETSRRDPSRVGPPLTFGPNGTLVSDQSPRSRR